MVSSRTVFAFVVGIVLLAAVCAPLGGALPSVLVARFRTDTAEFLSDKPANERYRSRRLQGIESQVQHEEKALAEALPQAKKLMLEKDLVGLMASELHHLNRQATAHEMFGKGMRDLDNPQLKTMGQRILPALRNVFNFDAVTPQDRLFSSRARES